MIWRGSVILAISASVIQSASAGGRAIDVYLRDSSVVRGELLSIRDTALVITSTPGAPDTMLAAHPGMVSLIGWRNVVQVRSEGRSNVGLGMGIGFAAGLLIGVAAAQSVDANDPDYYNTLTPKLAIPLRSGGIGLCAGALIGLTASSADIDVKPQPGYQFTLLRRYARYEGDEPEHLKARK